jgi:hypothetical protein
MFVELSFTLDDLKICFARKKEVAAWSELKVCASVSCIPFFFVFADVRALDQG